MTKLWAVAKLKPRFEIPLVSFFHLTYVENTGAAFGVGARKNGFFIAVSLALLAVLLYFNRIWSKTEKSAWLKVGAILVIGGALGNLYDRIAYGYVVDFLDFRVWPVFNVADSCISVGAVCLGLGLY